MVLKILPGCIAAQLYMGCCCSFLLTIGESLLPGDKHHCRGHKWCLKVRLPTTTYSFLTNIKHNIIINTNKILAILSDNNYPRKAGFLQILPCKNKEIWRKQIEKSQSQNKIRNTDCCAVRICMAGSALVLLGCKLCTERMFCTPPCGQQEVCCSLEKVSLLASFCTFFRQTE